MNIEIKSYRKNRTVYINSEIDDSTSLQIKKDIQEIINDDNEIYEQNIKEIAKLGEEFVELFKKNYKRPKITIEITSPGGSIYNGLGKYDFIRSKKENEGYNFECIASGFIASMATIIILSCEKRIGLPNTSFMIHSLSSLSYGKFQTLKENIEECERLNNILFEIYTNNTKITENELNEINKLKKDWWFNSNKALEIGLINEIRN